MKTVLIAVLSLLTLPLAAQTIYDPNIEAREISGFSGIHVSNAIDLHLSQDDTEAVAVSAKNEQVRARIITEVKDGILYIYLDGRDWKNWGDQKVKAYVAVKNITRIQATGASDVKVTGTLKTESLKLVLSGASDFNGSVEVSNLHLEMSGASDVKIRGRAAFARIDLSGASDFKGYDLEIEVCKAAASGASKMQLNVRKELEAHANQASSIRYTGDATEVKLYSSQASSIKRKA